MENGASIRIVSLLALSAATSGVACSSQDERPNRTFIARGSPHSLVYERPVFFEGLDEHVLMHKGPDGVWCRRPDGSTANCEQLRVLDRAALRESRGAMTRELAATIARARNGEELSMDVLYRVEKPAGLNVTDSAARAEYSRRILAGDANLTSIVMQLGGRVVRHANATMPLVTVAGRPDVLRKIARLETVSVALNASTGGRRGYPTDPGRTDSITYSTRTASSTMA